MITREKLDEVENTIRDLRMAMNFKENMDNNEPFMVLPLLEPITVVIDEAKKSEVNTKVSELEAQLKTKLTELTEIEVTK